MANKIILSIVAVLSLTMSVSFANIGPEKGQYVSYRTSKGRRVAMIMRDKKSKGFVRFKSMEITRKGGKVTKVEVFFSVPKSGKKFTKKQLQAIAKEMVKNPKLVPAGFERESYELYTLKKGSVGRFTCRKVDSAGQETLGEESHDFGGEPGPTGRGNTWDPKESTNRDDVTPPTPASPDAA